MAKINKKITNVLETTSPEKMKELAGLCTDSANTLRETAALLDETSKAFYEGNFAAGAITLKKAEDRIATA